MITAVWAKISKISYLREFSAQVSQIVYSAQLTVLRPLTSKYEKSSLISYLRLLSTQVSRIVFLARLTVLLFLQPYEEKLQKSH